MTNPKQAIGRTTNINPKAILSGPIPVTDAIPVLLSDANARRTAFIVFNDTREPVWIMLQPISEFTIAAGFKLGTNGIYEMNPDTIYSGDITAIADKKDSVIYITEY